jgi:hypothetical protein
MNIKAGNSGHRKQALAASLPDSPHDKSGHCAG